MPHKTLILGSIMLLTLFSVNCFAKLTLVFSSINEDHFPTKVCFEVLNVASKRLNITLKILSFPAARSLKMANNGITDGELSRIAGLEKDYTNLYKLDTSCYSHNVYFYVKPSKKFIVNAWDNLPTDYLLGHRKGVYFIEKAAKKYDISTYPLVHLSQVAGLLSTNRIDVAVGSTELAHLLVKNIQAGNIIQLRPAVEQHKFYSYLHAKNKHLLVKLNREMASMEKLGEIEIIEHKIKLINQRSG